MDIHVFRPKFPVCVRAITLGVAITICGCGSTSSVENRSTTVGKELEDLAEARNKGLLTEDEYNKQREAIMKRR